MFHKKELGLVVVSMVLLFGAGNRAFCDDTAGDSSDNQTSEEVAAQLGEEGVRGVNPADNISKFEILPKYTKLSATNDTSIFTTTLKYDKAIQGSYGVNVELPLSNYDYSGGAIRGNGDLNIRGRYQFSLYRWTMIIGAELVAPIASDDALGTGKWQLNPTLAAVYAFSRQTFGVLTAKHFLSVAGDSDRSDIVQGQYRFILAYTTKSGWWFLADPQLWVDYRNGGQIEFSPEAEVGKMVASTVGVFLRGGGHAAGDWDRQDWSVSGGIRLIFF